MGTPLSDWRRRVHELLADGEWHEQDPVVRDAMRLVPPGPAYRQAETSRKNRPDAPEKRTQGTDADAIAAGQRQIVMQSIYAGVRYGSFDRKREGKRIYIRDLTVGKRPSGSTDIDDLIECLKRQLKMWEKARPHLPKGAVRDTILGADPEKDIIETLRNNGRL